jgi:hypothetical protein
MDIKFQAFLGHLLFDFLKEAKNLARNLLSVDLL